MTKDEFKVAIGILAGAYRNFEIKDKISFDIWFEVLRDIDFEDVKLALYKHISESEYPPTVASIRKAVVSIKRPEIDALSPASAWDEVKMAIRRFGYTNESEAVASLSEIPRKIVLSMGYRTLCMSENEMADRAHFIKMFDAEKNRISALAIAPPVVNKAIETNKEKIKLLTNGIGRINEKGRT